MIPIYLFLAISPRISRRTVWLFSISFSIIALVYDKFISVFVMIFPRYRTYLKVTKLFVEKRSIYRYGDVLLAVILQIALLYVIVKNDKEDRYDEMACVLGCMNSIYVCMAYLVTNAEIFVRVKGIFGYWMVLSIPYIVVKYMGNNKFLKTFIAILSIAYLWRLGVKDGDGVIPYSFFWNS